MPFGRLGKPIAQLGNDQKRLLLCRIGVGFVPPAHILKTMTFYRLVGYVCTSRVPKQTANKTQD